MRSSRAGRAAELERQCGAVQPPVRSSGAAMDGVPYEQQIFVIIEPRSFPSLPNLLTGKVGDGSNL